MGGRVSSFLEDCTISHLPLRLFNAIPPCKIIYNI